MMPLSPAVVAARREEVTRYVRCGVCGGGWYRNIRHVPARHARTWLFLRPAVAEHFVATCTTCGKRHEFKPGEAWVVSDCNGLAALKTDDGSAGGSL